MLRRNVGFFRLFPGGRIPGNIVRENSRKTGRENFRPLSGPGAKMNRGVDTGRVRKKRGWNGRGRKAFAIGEYGLFFSPELRKNPAVRRRSGAGGNRFGTAMSSAPVKNAPIRRVAESGKPPCRLRESGGSFPAAAFREFRKVLLDLALFRLHGFMRFVCFDIS